VGGALGQPRTNRQDGLGAFQGLDLALFVDAQHDGALRRVEIQADDILDLGDELRIGGELEGPNAVGLEAELPPDHGDGEVGHADLIAQQPR
jgi:hypothetical protein